MSERTTERHCPFCDFIRTNEPVVQHGAFFAKYDSYPVSRGHMLLIPRRHVESLFGLDENELQDCFTLLLEVRDMIQHKFAPDGFNVGVNVGAAAGQTIAHLHIHVIPRYSGDVENPRGGVRRVIPGLADYPSDDV